MMKTQSQTSLTSCHERDDNKKCQDDTNLNISAVSRHFILAAERNMVQVKSKILEFMC